MIDLAIRRIIPAALQLLPPAMDSPPALAMLLAIGLQESRFVHRRQQQQGPARGFWQFETAGVRAVLQHQESAAHARAVLDALQYSAAAPAWVVQSALEHNDILAAAFARLLLWTLPQALPGPQDRAAAWGQYLDAWRPGKPQLASWAGCYRQAWDLVDAPGILA